MRLPKDHVHVFGLVDLHYPELNRSAHYSPQGGDRSCTI
jgi:hypothetical protein